MCRKKLRNFISLSLISALVLSLSFPVSAAEPEASVSSRTVSQEINGSNQYVYDGNETDPTMPSLVVKKPSTGQWGYVDGGQVQNVSGLYPNWHGFWFIQNGWVDFNVNGVQKAGDGWYSFTGGSRTFTDNGIVLNNSNGWWYCRDGQVDFNYTGFGQNENGWWYCSNGQVDFNISSVIQGTVAGENAWWNVQGGQVQFVNCAASNSNGIWYISGGKVDFNFNGSAYGYNFVGGKAQ